MKNTPFFFIKKSLAALLALIAIVAAFSCQNNSVDEIVNDNGNAKEAALSQSMKIDGLKENLSNQDAYKVANIFLSNKGTRAYSKKVSKIIFHTTMNKEAPYSSRLTLLKTKVTC